MVTLIVRIGCPLVGAGRFPRPVTHYTNAVQLFRQIGRRRILWRPIIADGVPQDDPSPNKDFVMLQRLKDVKLEGSHIR